MAHITQSRPDFSQYKTVKVRGDLGLDVGDEDDRLVGFDQFGVPPSSEHGTYKTVKARFWHI